MSCVFTKCLHNLWALSAVQVQHSHHLRALHAQRVQHSTSFGHPVFKKCNTPSVLAENGPSPIRLRRLYFRISGSWGGPAPSSCDGYSSYVWISGSRQGPAPSGSDRYSSYFELSGSDGCSIKLPLGTEHASLLGRWRTH